MKTINLTITLLLLLVISCTSKTPKNKHSTDSLKSISAIDSAETNTSKKSILNSENLATQTFTIDASEKKTFTSKGGVKFTIPKNCFVDSEGNTIKGEVEIEYKEALDPTNIVLGNMTTTYNGKFLESGGMIYINASANGEQLSLANNKALGFEVPAAKRKDGMMLFEGKEENGKINWVEPKKIDELAKDKPAPKEAIIRVPASKIRVSASNLRKASWWKYQNYYADLNTKDTFTFVYKLSVKKGVKNQEPITPEKNKVLLKKLNEIIKNDNTINDSTVEIGDFSVRFKTNISFQEILDGQQDFLSEEGAVFPQVKGRNAFSVDKTASYFFKVKKLGWANIDRLFSDPRTKDVNFVTKIDGYDAFDKLYISILFPKQKMYIPGYQKKDGSFSFTHGDYEEPKFPIGETAIIIATGYKKDIPYLATKKLVIAKEQEVSLQLKETTEKQLKADLKAKI